MERLASLFLVLPLFIGSLRSQVITISFEGTLNDAPIPLDSILVMNLTAGGDTTIYFPDQVLVLDGTTGLQEMAAQAPVLHNQPNPFDGGTDILVSTGNSGQALLTVHDATGREVAAYASSLAAGQHRFRYTAATPGVHVLTVLQGAARAAHRLVALAGEASGTGLVHAGSDRADGAAKSDRSLFTWTAGDELRYIGYVTDAGIAQSAAIDEVPVATATRNFELFAGLACPESPTVTDIDGNVYRNVQIGGQCWMAENLSTSTYANGDPIPNVTDAGQWSGSTSGAWCHYLHDEAYDASYGKLYNNYAVLDPRFVCPAGWHVSTEAEWIAMAEILGGPDVAGDKLKSTGVITEGTGPWSAPNADATNESGFSAFPGGTCHFSGDFYNSGLSGQWWSPGVGSPTGYRQLSSFVGSLTWSPGATPTIGYSVRCVRD